MYSSISFFVRLNTMTSSYGCAFYIGAESDGTVQPAKKISLHWWGYGKFVSYYNSIIAHKMQMYIVLKRMNSNRSILPQFFPAGTGFPQSFATLASLKALILNLPSSSLARIRQTHTMLDSWTVWQHILSKLGGTYIGGRNCDVSLAIVQN